MTGIGKGLAIAERLTTAAPESADFARNLSVSYNKLGDIEHTLSRPETARDWYQKGLAIRERLASAAPESADFARTLSISYEQDGRHRAHNGPARGGRRLVSQTIGVLAESLAEAAPESATFAGDLSTSYDKLGHIEHMQGRPRLPATGIGRGLPSASAWGVAARRTPIMLGNLFISYDRLGDLERSLGQPLTARNWYQKGLSIAKRLAEAAPRAFRPDLSIEVSAAGRSQRHPAAE